MGWALPIDQWAIEPLYDGDPANQSPASFGVYRRTQHGWHRVSEKTSKHAAEVKLGHLKARDYVQASITTRPDEA
jgi:hypothetical protein